MSTKFSDALAPLTARLPRAARDLEILRVSAQLGAGDLIASSKAERRVVLVWAQKHVGGKLTNRSFRKTTSNWNPVTFTSLNPIDPTTLAKNSRK